MSGVKDVSTLVQNKKDAQAYRMKSGERGVEKAFTHTHTHAHTMP